MEERDQQNKINRNIPLNSDGLLNMNEVISSFKNLVNEKRYRDALSYLNNIKNDAHLVNHTDIIKLHDLYIEILLIIEDFKSLENILKSKSKYIESKKDENMHQFYLAICYEGLNKIEDAISALENIEDTISKKNLTNKYLKLALLYLQIKQPTKAKKSYEHATVFDRQKDNDMFLLVDSDIHYFEKNYIDSMKLFEDFFIKTKRRLAYLNRFIRISLALGRENDAYEFYKRYKEIIIDHESIQVKLSFFKSAIEFLRTIDQDEFIEANNYISVLNQRDIIDFDDFDYYRVVLKHLKKHKIYQKEREIIRDLFIDLDQVNIFKKLVYLEVENAELHVYHYSKNLLLEKTIENNHLITDDILSQKYKQTYNHVLIDDFIFVDDSVDYIFVEALDQGKYLLTYTNENHFDLAKKITILSKHLIIDKLNEFYLRKKQHNQFEAINSLLAKTNYGLIRISANMVYILNAKASKLLNIDESVIKFKIFQELFQPVIYLDEMYHKKTIECQFNDIQLTMDIHALDDDIFVLLSQHQVKKEKIDLYELKQTDDSSMMMIDLYNYNEIHLRKSHKSYLQFIQDLKENIYKYSNQHVTELFYEGNHIFYLLLDTKDKRIPERLIHKLMNEYSDLCDFRAVYHVFNLDIISLLDNLQKMMRLTTPKQPVILNYKSVKLDNELRHTYLETIKNLISHKKAPLRYHYITDWRNQNVIYMDVEYNHLDILNDLTLVKSVLDQNHLNIQFDRLIINQLINDVKKQTIKSRWIVPISNQTIESKKAFNYILRRLDIIDDQKVVFKLNINDYLNLSSDDRSYLKNKNINLCLNGMVETIRDLSIYEKQHLLMISHEMINIKLFNSILHLIKPKVKEVIYDHQDHTLKKADLSENKIYLIKGDFSGRTEKLNQE